MYRWKIRESWIQMGASTCIKYWCEQPPSHRARCVNKRWSEHHALLYYIMPDCSTTAIAGIMHLVLAPNLLGFNINFALFFIVAGIAQLFWVIADDKEVGLSLGRSWHSWNGGVNLSICNYKDAQSYYRERSSYKLSGTSNRNNASGPLSHFALS